MLCAREGSNLQALRRWNLNRAIGTRTGPNGGISGGCGGPDGANGLVWRTCRQFADNTHPRMRLKRRSDQGGVVGGDPLKKPT